MLIDNLDPYRSNVTNSDACSDESPLIKCTNEWGRLINDNSGGEKLQNMLQLHGVPNHPVHLN